MAFEILSKNIKINKKTVISFPDKTIKSFIVGFSDLNLTYEENRDHHVREIALNIQSELSNSNTISVTPLVVMNDNTGHRIPDGREITISIAAVVDSANTNVKMATDVAENESVETDATAVFAYPALTYFSTRYEGGDHHLAELSSSVSLSNKGGTSFKLNGSTKMKDIGVNRGVAEPERGSVIISKAENIGITCTPLSSLDAEKTETANRLANAATKRIFFVNDFKVKYSEGEDHHVKTIRIALGYENNKVTYTAMLEDISGHVTNIGKNYVNGFMITV